MSALFWFPDRENVELVVKILDGCALNDRFRRNPNPLGRPFPPVQVVNTLASCSVESVRASGGCAPSLELRE